MEGRVRARLTRSEGRKFGVPVGLAFMGLAGVFWWHDRHSLAVAATSIGSLLVVAGLLIPTRLGPVYRAWMAMAHAISKITVPLFMGIVYFIVITPIGILRRVIGQNPVEHVPEEGSYWKDRPEGARKGDLERQF